MKALSYGDYQELVLTNRQYAFARNYDGKCVVTAVNNDDSDVSLSLPVGGASQYQEQLSGERVSVADGRIQVQVKANSGGIWVPVSGDAAFKTEDGAVKTEAAGDRPTERAASEEKAAASSRKAGAPGRKGTEPKKKKAEEPGRNKTASEEKKAGASGRKKAASGKKTAEPTAEQPERPKKKAEARKVSENRKKTYEEMDIQELQQAILERMAMNGPITDRMRQDVMENVYHNSLVNWIKSFR